MGIMTEPTTTSTERKKRGKATKPRDPNRVPKTRERSPRMLAMAALDCAEKKRPALLAKLAGLTAAQTNLAKLDEEIRALRADVVRITNEGAAVTGTADEAGRN